MEAGDVEDDRWSADDHPGWGDADYVEAEEEAAALNQVVVPDSVRSDLDAQRGVDAETGLAGPAWAQAGRQPPAPVDPPALAGGESAESLSGSEVASGEKVELDAKRPFEQPTIPSAKDAPYFRPGAKAAPDDAVDHLKGARSRNPNGSRYDPFEYWAQRRELAGFGDPPGPRDSEQQRLNLLSRFYGVPRSEVRAWIDGVLEQAAADMRAFDPDNQVVRQELAREFGLPEGLPVTGREAPGLDGEHRVLKPEDTRQPRVVRLDATRQELADLVGRARARAVEPDPDEVERLLRRTGWEPEPDVKLNEDQRRLEQRRLEGFHSPAPPNDAAEQNAVSSPAAEEPSEDNYWDNLLNRYGAHRDGGLDNLIQDMAEEPSEDNYWDNLANRYGAHRDGGLDNLIQDMAEENYNPDPWAFLVESDPSEVHDAQNIANAWAAHANSNDGWRSISDHLNRMAENQHSLLDQMQDAREFLYRRNTVLLLDDLMNSAEYQPQAWRFWYDNEDSFGRRIEDEWANRANIPPNQVLREMYNHLIGRIPHLYPDNPSETHRHMQDILMRYSGRLDAVE